MVASSKEGTKRVSSQSVNPRPKILVAEDDQLQRELIKNTLGIPEEEILFCEDGK